jgi:hypothetical protein
MVVNRLARLLCDLEANGPSRLSLADASPIDGTAIGCYVSDPQTDDVTSTKFAIDGEVEQREIPETLNNWGRVLTAQTCFGRRGGFAPVILPLFQG